MARQPLRLAPRPLVLAGREGLLAELRARLAAREGASGPRVVALWGLGGAGKTSVALEYAYRHLAEVGVAWQFPAEDPAVLAASFGELAAQLGARELLDAADPVASVHGVLAVYPAEWLLVFDNATDRASVAPFVPPAGRGRVLITSRNQIWPPGQALDVPVLDPHVAAEFLINRTGDADRRAALELAGELGGLPLALEQAAAYVQASGDSLAGYLASFVQRRPEMLRRGEPTGYPETVATTWKLAFEDLQRAAPGAVGLLRLLAFCAPEAIPLRLLLQPRPGLAGQLGEEVASVLAPLMDDRLAAGDAIAALRRYSLISPPADGSVSVHRLVQAVTADQMPAELAGNWRQAAATLIEAAIPAYTDLPETWHEFAQLLPHAQAALPAGSYGMFGMVSYLGHSGSYSVAIDLGQRLLEARVQVYGPEDPETLAARGNLAYWIGQAGDAAAARDQYAALVPLDERVLGPENPETLNVRQNLAMWTAVAGDATRARDQYAALMPTLDRVLGAEDGTTLTARGNLAYLTGQEGHAAEARDQYAALAPVYERVFGPEYPQTLHVHTNIAVWTGVAGDVAGARDQFAALVPVYERTLNPEHPLTLRVRSHLALMTGQAGDAAGARDQYAALAPVYERVLGPENSETLDIRTSLADWTRKAKGDAGSGVD